MWTDQGRSFISLLSQGSLIDIVSDYSKFIRQHNKKSDVKKLFYFLPFLPEPHVVVFVISIVLSLTKMDSNKTPHFRRKTSRSYYTPEGKENFDPNFLLCTPKSTPDISSPTVSEFDEDVLSKTRTVQKKNKKKKKKSKQKIISDTSSAAVSPSDIMSLSHLVSDRLHIMS